VKLPEIMKAKKKPLDVIEPGALGLEVVETLKVVRYEPPSQRTRGVMVKTAGELVAQLKARGVLQ
jgi:electron transfer flavoprotein beta subunit